MATVELGRKVDKLIIHVVRTDPFVQRIGTVDHSDWDVTDIRITFPDSTAVDWVGTVNGEFLEFNIPDVDVDATIEADPQVCHLVGDGLTWAVGGVLKVTG